MRGNSSNKRAKENIFKNVKVVQRGLSPLNHFLLEIAWQEEKSRILSMNGESNNRINMLKWVK